MDQYPVGGLGKLTGKRPGKSRDFNILCLAFKLPIDLKNYSVQICKTGMNNCELMLDENEQQGCEY